MTNKNINKFIALFIAILFLTVSLLAIAFICKHANHDCSGQGCVVCEQLDFANNICKKIAMALANTLSICLSFFFISSIQSSIMSNLGLPSLVTLKVRMNH